MINLDCLSDHVEVSVNQHGVEIMSFDNRWKCTARYMSCTPTRVELPKGSSIDIHQVVHNHPTWDEWETCLRTLYMKKTSWPHDPSGKALYFSKKGKKKAITHVMQSHRRYMPAFVKRTTDHNKFQSIAKTLIDIDWVCKCLYWFTAITRSMQKRLLSLRLLKFLARTLFRATSKADATEQMGRPASHCRWGLQAKLDSWGNWTALLRILSVSDELLSEEDVSSLPASEPAKLQSSSQQGAPPTMSAMLGPRSITFCGFSRASMTWLRGGSRSGQPQKFPKDPHSHPIWLKRLHHCQKAMRPRCHLKPFRHQRRCIHQDCQRPYLSEMRPAKNCPFWNPRAYAPYAEVVPTVDLGCRLQWKSFDAWYPRWLCRLQTCRTSMPWKEEWLYSHVLWGFPNYQSQPWKESCGTM